MVIFFELPSTKVLIFRSNFQVPAGEQQLRPESLVRGHVVLYPKPPNCTSASYFEPLHFFCVLTDPYSYRAENLILAGMTPGPKEPTAEQLQHYLKLIVDDLIMLHERGIVIKTPLHPNCNFVHFFTMLNV